MSSDNALGARMKDRYEDRARAYLPRRTYTILRVDGKAFHSFLRHAQRPYDDEVAAAMEKVGAALLTECQGSRLGYTQSDEVSVLLTDFEKPSTAAWFDGNVQKMVSVAAARATATFNDVYRISGSRALFDARVFTIPDRVEVINYFIWRQQDAVRNSIQMLAHSLYSEKEMYQKNTSVLQEMCFAKGHNWNDVPARHKRGAVVKRVAVGLADRMAFAFGPGTVCSVDHSPPIFTQERAYLEDLVPVIWAKEGE